MEKMYERLTEHQEPAHVSVVKLYEDLVKLYKQIRGKVQLKINKAFDKASEQIGFVVATTMPYHIEVGKNGNITAISIGIENLKGTLFDTSLTGVLEGLGEVTGISAGKYSVYLLWEDALKLKLGTGWLEPAHFRMVRQRKFEGLERAEASAVVRSEVMEPVHWFDPRIALRTEEAIQISVIDEVYPELRLSQRVLSVRRMEYIPGVREPAHFRKIDKEIEHERLPDILTELSSILRRYGY